MSKRDQILQAAARITREKGAVKLTLDAVALEAGVSKGGLLYHFRSKEELVKGLLHYTMTNFMGATNGEQDLQPEGTDEWVQTYVKRTFATLDEEWEMTNGLLAAISTDPELMQPVRETFQAWQTRIEAHSSDPVMSTILRLAADGLWFAELFNVAPIQGEFRERVLERMMQLAQQKGE